MKTKLPYNCQKCKKDCGQLYTDKYKKKWICEKCWEEEVDYVEED